MQSILILEDMKGIRAWQASMLREVFPAAELFEADCHAMAERLLAERSFNLALVDLNLPDGSGIDITRIITARHPQTYVVITTIFDDDYHVFEALKAGAHGYLLKEQSRGELVEKLRGILKGEPPLSPAIARKILRHFREQPAMPRETGLTPREEEVLLLIAKGYSLQETAQLLGRSRNTIAGHTRSIYRKLNITSRAEAALEATRLGLIQASEAPSSH